MQITSTIKKIISNISYALYIYLNYQYIFLISHDNLNKKRTSTTRQCFKKLSFPAFNPLPSQKNKTSHWWSTTKLRLLAERGGQFIPWVRDILYPSLAQLIREGTVVRTDTPCPRYYLPFSSWQLRSLSIASSRRGAIEIDTASRHRDSILVWLWQERFIDSIRVLIDKS